MLGVLQWTNENGLANYPLTAGIGTQDFIVDASFTQFDGFVPVLVSILPTSVDIQLTFTFDFGSAEVKYTKAAFDAGINFIRIYSDLVNSRYIGTITFGPGTDVFWQTKIGSLQTLNVPFIAGTVKSIPSSLGLFSLGGLFGPVTVSRPTTLGAEDDTIFFNTLANVTTFNAVLHHAFLTTPPAKALKLLNEVGPLQEVVNGYNYSTNAVTISNNDTVKFNTSSSGSLNVDLIRTASVPNSNAVPSLSQ